jgi:hypothetical protein
MQTDEPKEGVRTMPLFLSTHKDQVLREKYGDYCLEAILSGEEAKPFEDFQREVRV